MTPARVASLMAEAVGGAAAPGADGATHWRWQPASSAVQTSVGVAWTRDWLTLSEPCAALADHLPLARLHLQSGWPALLRLTPEWLPVVCGDVPLRLGDAAGQRWTIQQLRLLAHSMHAVAARSGFQGPPGSVEGAVAAVLAALPDTLALRGWQATLTSEGLLRVPLPLPGTCQSLEVSPCGQGLCCELMIVGHDFKHADSSCTQALTLCLLRAGASLRWVQPCLVADGEVLRGAGFRCW